MRIENLFNYAEEHFMSEPEFLWAKFPNYAVLRHNENKKWFAIIMDVHGYKLGLNIDEIFEVINVKARPDNIHFLLQTEGILPAYHMNKRHWISVLLSSTLSADEIYEMIHDSYELISNSRRKQCKKRKHNFFLQSYCEW